MWSDEKSTSLAKDSVIIIVGKRERHWQGHSPSEGSREECVLASSYLLVAPSNPRYALALSNAYNGREGHCKVDNVTPFVQMRTLRLGKSMKVFNPTAGKNGFLKH